jgi:hypothetical protein
MAVSYTSGGSRDLQAPECIGSKGRPLGPGLVALWCSPALSFGVDKEKNNGKDGPPADAASHFCIVPIS